MLFQSRKKKAVFTLLILSLLSVVYTSLNWTGIIDDAYIFFRYAHNISQGHGYVYNIGHPVEGTSSVTWTILLAILDNYHIPAEVSVKILGGLCLLAILFLLWAVFFETEVPSSIMFLVFALLIFNKNFILSLMIGLETGLYSLLLLAICITFKWYSERGGRFLPITTGVIGVLLFLTRPESIALLLLIGCGIVYYRQKYNVQYSLTPIIIWILGISIATLWRWSVFGDFIPNSARAKSVLAFSEMHWSVLWPRIVQGSLYVKNLFRTSWFLAVLGVVGLVIMRKSFWVYVAFSALFTGIGVTLMNSGDWMPFFRLLTPYLPIIALLAGIGLSKLLVLLGKRWTRIFELTSILVAILITLNAFWLLRGIEFFSSSQWPVDKCYLKIGQVLRPYLSEQTIVAPEAIGHLGYSLIDIPILDTYGLTDSYIAHNGVIPIETYNYGKHNYEYVMQQSPTLFLFHSDIINHIPPLNHWGYSQEYETFRITDMQAKCELFVGVKNSLVPELLPVLEKNFKVQIVDTRMVQNNPSATWPEGER